MLSVADQIRRLVLRWEKGTAPGGALALAGVLVLPYVRDAAIGVELTRNTIRLSLAWYFAALMLMMRLPRAEWNATTPRGRLVRWCWTWGAVCFLVHLAMAYHFFHQWSHSHAFAHTREVSGIGEGIYVSYLFTWLWVGDVVWWWGWPACYAARPVWFHRCLHTFILFIVFNGTVVFESGMIRWFAVAMFSVLALAWVRSLRQLRVGLA